MASPHARDHAGRSRGGCRRATARSSHTFGVLINDGLSMREEAIASAFGNALGMCRWWAARPAPAPTREPNMFLGDRVLDQCRAC